MWQYEAKIVAGQLELLVRNFILKSINITQTINIDKDSKA